LFAFGAFSPFFLRALRKPSRTLRLKNSSWMIFNLFFSLNILFIVDCVRDGSDILLRYPYF
ncbi:hypothetical protein, partial [Flavobacterium sp. UGB4466]|uniref:hypothetical protein n=1 Tax=Flavobacterium sp. UGB4466 TaxID=2730889 RepID=UPI001ED9610C